MALALTAADLTETREGEAALLERARTGDEDAWRQLFAALRAPIYGILWRAGLTRGERDDLAQDIFLKIHKGLRGGTVIRSLRPWALTIAVQALRSHFRRRRPPPGSDEALVAALAETPLPPEVLEGDELGRFLAAAIARLGTVQREVLLLSCVDGLEQDEVARLAEIPVNTVKTHLRRARLVLAKALAKRRLRLARESGE